MSTLLYVREGGGEEGEGGGEEGGKEWITQRFCNLVTCCLCFLCCLLFVVCCLLFVVCCLCV